ncbi:MAG: histidine--tRNA ligase [Epsilonproteobacteria bacterium]|nr:histidine--tRNA ligase [Campylobacterota bacterium]OIO16598.1 MAG: histidine--tRNA ligase [Helicobacteraceae bacterium CG1_02_36_14]PIP11207.1 MAG: histidine--tRNA ligase [Sulfurimonas sp. CG23_combo_of_CG06-09_8_20_14_all_36_33]PIS27092.1 MAG: histidine--tRNA ligase [Sulfurimonas sp. CG08_land_8_20_14_0_20_36_33]PIU33698.1 MAG: histidine--tRNA ligase [Sulfurimonas sp. CG07_land_8_20_14_0_80_36_56]PIV05296.1 MAG: histidine--tRNA ligase [Sulfurimonas sp. CG03_land_8_20_14_0_80_36_25]PIV3455
MISSLRGMNDILSEDYERFTYFINTATKIAQKYGFHFIETPLLEETALFKRSVGESSDIVGKEMYQFVDKGENDVCLRPEGTAGVVRAFVQKKLDKAGGIHRYFYHGAMFRYERPQKGRLRQFHQFGVESFGVDSVYEDATMIMMVADILSACGIGYRLQLNSLGDSNCMPQYRDNLVSFIDSVEDQICEDCLRRKNTNPIRVLDCKNSTCQSLYVKAPKLINQLCGDCQEDFEKLKSLLDKNSIAYEIDTNLVRGLDYYSKTAFEFVSDDIGSQSAIAGGGRYDRLVEFLDGRPTPAVGFAMGIERLMELIKMPEVEREGYYIGAMDDEAVDMVLQLTQKKRKTDKVTCDYKAKNLKNHLKAADKANARFCCVIGENEMKSSTVWVKDLQEKTEYSLLFEEF